MVERFIHFATTEEERERREQELAEPVDFLCSDRFKEELSRYHYKEGEDISESTTDAPEEAERKSEIRKLLAENEEKFMTVNRHRHKYIDSRNLSIFWRSTYQSSDPVIANIRQGVEAERDEETRLPQLIEAVSSRLENGTLPLDTWVNIITEYKNYIETISRRLIEMNEVLKGKFADIFVEKINPLISEPKTREEILRLIEDTVLTTTDPLKGGSRGGCNSLSNVTTVNFIHHIGSGARASLKTIVHEFLHAMTKGQVVEFRQPVVVDDSEEMQAMGSAPQWVGLETGDPTTLIARFRWLNEAVTEKLAGDALEIPISFQSYPIERQVFSLLCNGGKKKIDPKVFYDAYFETKGVLAPSNESKHKFWKAMMSEVEESFGKGFLVQFDSLVRHKGIEDSGDFLAARDPDNPQEINIKELEKEKEASVQAQIERLRGELEEGG